MSITGISPVRTYGAPMPAIRNAVNPANLDSPGETARQIVMAEEDLSGWVMRDPVPTAGAGNAIARQLGGGTSMRYIPSSAGSVTTRDLAGAPFDTHLTNGTNFDMWHLSFITFPGRQYLYEIEAKVQQAQANQGLSLYIAIGAAYYRAIDLNPCSQTVRTIKMSGIVAGRGWFASQMECNIKSTGAGAPRVTLLAGHMTASELR